MNEQHIVPEATSLYLSKDDWTNAIEAMRTT